jgi:hypothetical protein
MVDIKQSVIEMADKLVDKYHGVSGAIEHAEKKIDECIDSGFKYKNDKTMDDGSIRFWVDVHNELVERSNLEL